MGRRFVEFGKRLFKGFYCIFTRFLPQTFLFFSLLLLSIEGQAEKSCVQCTESVAIPRHQSHSTSQCQHVFWQRDCLHVDCELGLAPRVNLMFRELPDWKLRSALRVTILLSILAI